MTLAPGTKLGPYEILVPIGAGGMGEVWKARDTRLGRIVAIKKVKEQHSERFKQEARSVAALNHPYICQLYDIGPDYLVLEYVEGKPLSSPLPESEAVRLAIQIATALEEAHQKGIIHRDLKPSNIMVTDKGSVKLLDFGLAKLYEHDMSSSSTLTVDFPATQAGVVLGTVAYMSPEQAQGQPVDARSDIFSLGLVLYEMLSGRRAFSGDSNFALMTAIVKEDPPPLQASPSLEKIVRRCLAKQRSGRYQNMSEVKTALEQFITKKTIATSAEAQPSIAVLPFVNMSGDKEQEYFSDGLSEEVINALAHIPNLKVIARTSAFAFKGKQEDIRRIADALGVANILEGSVRKAGNRIRVTAQLIKAADGFHLWSERYDREMTDIFAIQDEITQAIAAALQVKLSPEAAALPRHTPNLRAYEEYLKARDYWFKATPESLARFKESVDHAIEFDPGFALPYSLLGSYYTTQANLGMRPAREVIPLARSAEQEALRVSPSLPEAHAMMGVCAGMSYDWNEAEGHWRLAMAREPVSRDVRFWYGNHYLLPTGHSVEAVAVMERSLQEDPLNLLYRHLFAVGLLHAGRPQDAEAELRKVLEVDEYPLSLGTLGVVRAQQERFEEALALTERAHALMPWANPIIGQLAALLIRTGARSRADMLIEKLRFGNAYGASAGLAVFYALCGEFDQAAEWAEQAIEEQYGLLVHILRPLLRSTPRWPALARLMNLPEETR